MHIHHDHIAGGHTREDSKPSMEELIALMKYMVDHNAAHTEELAELAEQLDQAGKHAAYHRVMDAVANFDVGNTTLAAVLEDLTRNTH